MMGLNMERDKLKDELAKIPMNAKTAAQIRRRPLGCRAGQTDES